MFFIIKHAILSFFFLVAKNISLKYQKKQDKIIFAEILTRNAKLSEELKRKEKLDSKNTVKFFQDCEFKLNCRCNLEYNLKLNTEEDFQVIIRMNNLLICIFSNKSSCFIFFFLKFY